MKIYNRFTGAVILELDGYNFSGANLQEADLRGADFRGADFRGADFRGADFRGADFRGANLDGALLDGANLNCARGIIHIQWQSYPLWIQLTHTRIGCHYRPNDEWYATTPDQAEAYSGRKFTIDELRAYKNIIRAGVAALAIR